MNQVPHLIMGTAGHVDHGKTTLIERLTGVDLDTLPEEKKRGLTINLGFTYFDTPSGMRIGVVDVPGHKRFIHTMVSGAQGIDFVLFLVACDDSVMPQTREHLEILRLMGIERGIVVMTKSDLADEETRELVKEDVKDLLKGSFLEDAPALFVSSVTGEGIDELKAAIDELAQTVSSREAAGNFRMYVDRVFSVAGAGTVVTGTILSGSVCQGEELEVLPESGGARVRQIQVHGQTFEAAQAGQRCALNLKMSDKTTLEKGDLVAAAKTVRPTYMIDARIETLSDLNKPLPHWYRVKLYLGTREAFARVVLLDKEVLPVGQEAYVQFRFEESVPAVNGDFFIIRDVSGERTLGGGVVLDAHPVKHKRKRARMVEDLKTREKGYLAEILELEAKKAGCHLEIAKAALELGVEEKELIDAGSELVKKGLLVPVGKSGAEAFFHSSAWSRLEKRITGFLEMHHSSLPQLATGISEGEIRKRLEKDTRFEFPAELFSHVMERFAHEGKVRKVEATWALSGHKAEVSGGDKLKLEELLDRYRSNPYTPPETDTAIEESGLPREVAKKALAGWVEDGSLVRVSKEFLFDAEAVDRARQALLDYMNKAGQIKVSDFRELVGTSRKFAIPLMNYFDNIGVTIRDGDLRKPGPGKG